MYFSSVEEEPNLTNNSISISDFHFTILFNFHAFQRFLFSSMSSKAPSLLHSHYLTTTQFSKLDSISRSSCHLDSIQDLRKLKQTHAHLVVSFVFVSNSIASKLIRLYTVFNDFDSAVRIFNSLLLPDTMAWNLIIKSHIDSGMFVSALSLYKKMRQSGVAHDGFTFPMVNKIIQSIQVDFVYAETVHCLAFLMGFIADLYFSNTMIEVYVKFGSLVYARKLFDEMSQRDLVSWTSMISAYVYNGDVVSAFNLFRRMRIDMEPSSVTLMVMVQACCETENLILGRQLQCHVLKNGLLCDISLQNSLLQMYSRLGDEGEYEIVEFFSELDDHKNVVSWNILMSFYSLKGDIIKVFSIFNSITGEVTLSLETLTILVSSTASSDSEHNLFLGKNLHSLSIKTGICDSILQTSLLDMYGKFGELVDSTRLFEEIPYKSLITWGAMMSVFIQNQHFSEAVEVFNRLQAGGVKPSTGILKHLIDAHAHLGALLLGKAIHCYLVRTYTWENQNTHSETSILNMYVRCGSIDSARKLFSLISIKDVVSWSSMIEGYGAHGLGSKSLNLFHQMISEGIAPNKITFLSLLSACSHSGLVTEGCQIFYSMRSKFKVNPDLEHYTCLVDLLGRSAKVREALAIILKSMLNFLDGRIWGALMGACRVSGDKRIAIYAAKRLLELEPDNVGYYTLLSNTQASAGQWHEVEELRSVVYEKELIKKPGWSCIEISGKLHGFVSGDRSHNKTHEIYNLLVYLNRIE